MAQKSDNYLHAFDGCGIDWSVLLGSDIPAAPEHWVSLYRECSLEELARIAREGLAAPVAELRPSEMRREMEILDRFRPERLVEHGVSRLGAIFAAPSPENVPSLPFRAERMILEIKTDPASCFVGDMDFITGLIPFLGAYPADVGRFQGAFSKYWDSVMPLADFLGHYVKVRQGGSCPWVATAGAGEGRPKVFFSPEILIMKPIISQKHLRVIGRIEDPDGPLEQLEADS
ncbi:MAG: hypothetical protein WCT10_05875 [Patescibacteria group bacterium]|jgi:hypothetical protein